jgi:deoxyribonuclease V
MEEQWIRDRASFPYIPGLLSFRELPVLLKALERVKTDPQLILCDGQGIAHPRGLGLASHLGLLVDKPTIGCAKSRLVGEFSEVGEKKGSYAPLWYKERVVGAVVRTRLRVRPLFISPPTRQAHLLVSGLRRRQEVV